MPDKKKKSVSVIRSSAIIKNPVLFEAIGIAPVVAMAVSLKSAIILSFVTFVELLLIECLACLLMKKLKGSVRKMIYAILGLLINIPLFMLFRYLAPNETANAGIFLPLLAVNSLIALHCERFAVKHNFKATALDAVSAGFSYAAVILIVGVIREILGSGTVYSVKLNIPVRLPGLLMPFGGFLLLGFMAAALKAIINKKYPDKHPDASFDLSEVKQSHVIKLREFLDTDLDFFEIGEEEPQDEKKKPHTDKRKNSAAKRKTSSLSAKKGASAPAKSKKGAGKKGAGKNGASRSGAADTERQKDKSFGSSSEFEEILSELEKYKQYTAFDGSSASHSDTDKSTEKDGGAETQQPKGGEDK